MIGVHIFCTLQVDENETKQESRTKEELQDCPVATYQGVMCDRDGDAAGGRQPALRSGQGRIDGGQLPGSRHLLPVLPAGAGVHQSECVQACS